MFLTGSGQPVHGWLVVGADTTIVAADAAACILLGVQGPAELRGYAWTSLAAPSEAATVAEATAAVRSGRSWRGVVRFLGPSLRPVDVEIVPTEAGGGVALVHLHTSAPLTTVEPALPRVDDRVVLRAQVAAMEAIADLPEPTAAARGVLHALREAIDFDWGAVIRFVRDPRAPGPAAEVVAVYPAPMAGIGRGASWAPLDAAQAGVFVSGEPEMSTRLGNEVAAGSPLRRMPAFGMTSRIQTPLYRGSDVSGFLVVYASGAPLGPRDGMAIERIARPLGPRLEAAEPGTPQRDAARAGEAASAAPTPAPPPIPPPPAPPPPPTAAQVAAANAAAASASAGRLSALSEVVSGVAHELNNPLTAILGYAQIFHALDGAERDHAVQTIEREAQRAARIVRNLLSFARQEPPRISRVDIEEILRRVIDVMRYSLEVDNVRTELRFAGVPEVEADRSQLEQVFLNLVNNAQQALQPNGGEIVITTAVEDGQVHVSVADNGPGVPEEVRSRIFEPFFTTHPDGDGQGMGLSTVYGLVTQHGGRVWVEQSPLGGANFVVTLPIQRPGQTVPPAVLPTLPPRAASERVLVVDDELPIRALTSEILSHAGYMVTTATGGDEALRRLEAVTYDLVVADMRMPGMDGATLYEHICDRWPEMQNRVLFMTGDIEGERTSRRLARGDVRFLEKPFDTNALLVAIRAALDAQPRT
ncbi:MAG: hybrid sensor histidine kinase/response regulator [Dehalococcoidia bacterium]